MAETILEVKNLSTSFFTDSGEVKAVNGISFELEKGKVLGIVGESGSGKSVTAYSIMQILSFPGRVTGGEVLFKGTDLLKLPDKKMREFRGESISIIFQDPMTSLNPVYTIGNQLDEAIRLHTNRKCSEIRQRSLELIRLVGINDPARRVKQYPHELSGGMRQRVMIAMALACEPDILIADEPTTALDVTIQAQILELISELQSQIGMAVIIITHDLGVIADMCDEIIVMYAGSICERGTTDDIFYSPKHEYTKNLLRSIPKSQKSTERLVPIAGNPIDLLNLPEGCAFAPRCAATMKICLEEHPEEIAISETQSAACWVNVRDELEKRGTLKGEVKPESEGGGSE
ncbi:MAG: ABC transporter ATP-binding protein [Clostridiaceae bacterium]|nr:ABC transporter ATP-binding protein [Clostridiaceae bacterium]